MSVLLRAPDMPEQVWRIVPETTPRLGRHCASCGTARPFASSDRFRVNANGRRVDVWLIYRCTICERTWNRTVFERVAVSELEMCLRGLSTNDRELAWRCAFRIDDLATVGARVHGDVPFRVEGGEVDIGTPMRIRFAVKYPCAPRLDRVLAHTMCLPRSAIHALHSRGRIEVTRPALRKPVRNDLVVILRP